MNKKGFTLAELIGVVTLLGLIAIIAFPPLLKQLQSTKSKIDEATEKIIIAVTSNYLDENKNNFPRKDGNVYCISLQTLVDDGKLSKDLKNADGNEIDLKQYVEISMISNQYKYNIVDDCNEVK